MSDSKGVEMPPPAYVNDPYSQQQYNNGYASPPPQPQYNNGYAPPPPQPQYNNTPYGQPPQQYPSQDTQYQQYPPQQQPYQSPPPQQYQQPPQPYYEVPTAQPAPQEQQPSSPTPTHTTVIVQTSDVSTTSPLPSLGSPVTPSIDPDAFRWGRVVCVGIFNGITALAIGALLLVFLVDIRDRVEGSCPNDLYKANIIFGPAIFQILYFAFTIVSLIVFGCLKCNNHHAFTDKTYWKVHFYGLITYTVANVILSGIALAVMLQISCAEGTRFAFVAFLGVTIAWCLVSAIVLPCTRKGRNLVTHIWLIQLLMIIGSVFAVLLLCLALDGAGGSCDCNTSKSKGKKGRT